ncbi:SNF2-like protein [Penicillium cf. viridicatum]|uniref:SNF2-like protein n=1 Tax=Penicillium cf. viridicatum TaxID=2972119 RepID=A0A9W9JLK1_9EURO|nr:SNF2-like protein [Penicillium cf. viridicatum]
MTLAMVSKQDRNEIMKCADDNGKDTAWNLILRASQKTLEASALPPAHPFQWLIIVPGSHDQFRSSKQAEKASFQLAMNGREPANQSLLLKLLQQLQTEVDVFWQSDKAKDLLEKKANMDKRYEEELTAFLSLKPNKGNRGLCKKALLKTRSGDIEYDRSGRPKTVTPPMPEPNIEVVEEVESETGWATEDEDDVDLSTSLQESMTEKQNTADLEEFDQRMKWKQEGKVGKIMC